MIAIKIDGSEQFDPSTNSFYIVETTTVRLEHSLRSVAEWESKYHKPFLSQEGKTIAESIDYIRLMSIDDVDPLVFNNLNETHIKAINEYIEDPMTATTFGRQPPRGKKEIITAELIYYWMIANNIPFECEKWHLNRLLTLIRVCGIKNAPPKKMSKKNIMSQNAAINAARRAANGSTG